MMIDVMTIADVTRGQDGETKITGGMTATTAMKSLGMATTTNKLHHRRLRLRETMIANLAQIGPEEFLQ